MLTLTFGDLRNPQFHAALKTLGQVRALPGQVGYDVAKILQAIKAEEKIVQELFEKEIDEFLEKDEHGKPIPVNPAMPGQLKIKDGTTGPLNAKVQEFLKQEVRIERRKLKIDPFLQQLSGEEIMLLEPLFHPKLQEA